MNPRHLLRAALPAGERVYSVFAAVIAVILLGGLTISAWNAARTAAEQEARTRFEFQAMQVQDAITGRMMDYEQVLRGAAGLFAASVSVARSEWRS